MSEENPRHRAKKSWASVNTVQLIAVVLASLVGHSGVSALNVGQIQTEVGMLKDQQTKIETKLSRVEESITRLQQTTIHTGNQRVIREIVRATTELDRDNSSLWLPDGRPKVEPIEQILKRRNPLSPGITAALRDLAWHNSDACP